MIEKIEIKNYYCHPIAFIPPQVTSVKSWTEDEKKFLLEYAIALNSKAGIKELFLVNDFAIDLTEFSERYNMKIFSIISAENLIEIPSSLLVGNNLIVEIKNIEEIAESFLSQIVDLSAKLNLPLLLHFGRDLKSLGKIEQKYHKPPERFIEDFGFLDRKCYLLGCNYLDKDAISLLSNYNVKFIFTPLSDAEQGRGFLNFKLYENLDCFLGSEIMQNIDIIKEANFLRLENNNLLCSNSLIRFSNFAKLIDNSCNLSESEAKELLASEIAKKVENFEDLSTKFSKLLAQKGQKN